MTTVQIQSLLLPPDQSTSVDYAVAQLNSKFKSLDQLYERDTLEVLLQQSSESRNSLNAELAQSQQHIDQLVADTRSKAHEQLTAAQELALLRHSLADELASLQDDLESTTREVSHDGEASLPEPSLLEEIETLHRSLKELESVKGYVGVVHRALQLSEQSVKSFEQSSAQAPVSQALLSEYVSLQDLGISVKRACGSAEAETGQEVKLVAFLESLRRKTWLSLKDVLASSLLAAAEKLHWPMPVDYAGAKQEDRQAFERAFLSLLKLQELGEELNKGAELKGKEIPSREGLYPLQILTRPIALRFKYHFEGTRQTNRPDKPEWYFSHILNVAHEHRQFLDTIIQRILRSSLYSSINAWREFTLHLLPIVSRKIRKSMGALLPHPSLLAHTIYQALAFDNELREAGFAFAGTSAAPASTEKEWEGTSEVILRQKEWFDAWLNGERRFAEDQYNVIISAPDAWQIAADDLDDAHLDREVRPTNSARRIKALVEQITDRYRPLPRFLHKTRFLIAVQVPILELYHTRISESLDAFETLSSFLIRAVPGALAGQAGHGMDTKRMTTGVEGSQRLVKALVSARWIAAVMATWGEDLFFLELWHTICERAQLRAAAEANASLPDPGSSHDEGTIFEELVNQYKKLAERAEDMLVRQICGEVEAELKAHLYKPSVNKDQTKQQEDMAISQTLLAPIARLTSHLSFLSKNLPHNLVVSLYRRAASHIASHILQRALLYRGRGRMTVQEGRTLLDESILWVDSSRLSLGRSFRRVEAPWQRLLESCKLVSLNGDAFRRAVSVASLGHDAQVQELKSELGISELDTEEILDVLRIRDSFPA